MFLKKSNVIDLIGYMPNAMILSTLLPIPKDNNDLQNSHKYRGIALSAICIKVFEYIFLELYGHLLTSNELQFAYKSKSSTTQCTWMAREAYLIIIIMVRMFRYVY